jgi:arylsulfatase
MQFQHCKARAARNGQKHAKDDPFFGESWYSVDLWTDWGLKFADEAIEAKQPFFVTVYP